MARKHKTRSKLGVTKRVLRVARQRLEQRKKKLCQVREERDEVQGQILDLQETLIDLNPTLLEYWEIGFGDTNYKEIKQTREEIEQLDFDIRGLDCEVLLLQNDIRFASYWIPRIENQQDQPSDFSNLALEAQRQNLKDILRIRAL